jgi:uncharacterized protein
MKTILIILLVAFLFGCEIEIENAKTETIAVKYDSIKAIKYGADEYGMKKYILAYLKRGPNRDQDSVTAAELQKAHLKNITRLAEEGTLVLAGPFLDDEEVRGIYIFDVETIEEAKALTETDPAIKAGRLDMELRPWYGTAALKEITQISKTLEKTSISGE